MANTEPEVTQSDRSTTEEPARTDTSDEEPDEDIQPPSTARIVLEDFKKCSESHLWKLMMSFYDRKGPESWSQGLVPYFITCNAFIGRSYAKVLHGFLNDCMRPNSSCPMDPNHPLYIIELGAGSGKFTFFMLKALVEMREVCEFPMNKIVYVMTDFTQNNFRFWREHPNLKPFFESGQLDAGIFDAVNDESITLWRSGTVLRPNSVHNPVCIVANYLFDTLCHDIFQVDGGELKEGLISVGSNRKEEPDPLDPDIIQHLDNAFNYVAVNPDDYYREEDPDQLHFQRILRWYKDFFQDPSGASILIPIGALRALRRLTAFSNGRAIVLSGDKGNNSPDQFRGLMDPHIAVHGSFSVMVNYHAIGVYFTSRGGFAIHNPQEEASLKVSCFVLPGRDMEGDDGLWLGDAIDQKDVRRARAFPHLRMAFFDAIDQFGPNDFFVLQKALKDDAPNPNIKSVVAMLKLADWDPDVFYKFRDVILGQVPSCGHKLKTDLCKGIPRVWENFYALDLDKDVAFEIGRFYYGIREYDKALQFYEESNRSVGEHHVTWHNMGLCFYSKGQLATALTHFEKSLASNADYEKARTWIDRVRSELAGEPTVDPEETDGTSTPATTISTTDATGGNPSTPAI